MIIYTPIDMPEIEVDDWEVFWQIWKTESKPLVKNNIDEKASAVLYTRNIDKDLVVWTGIDLYRNEYENKPPVWHAPFVDVSKKLPIFYECIEEIASVFPIQCIRLVQSQIDISSHTDNNFDVWELRNYLYYSSSKPQWYFTKPKDVMGERYYMNLPKETSWFAYSDKSCWHGTDFDPENKKILLQIFPKDFFDSLKNIIVKNGIEKYKDYTIELN